MGGPGSGRRKGGGISKAKYLSIHPIRIASASRMAASGREGGPKGTAKAKKDIKAALKIRKRMSKQ